MVVFKYFFSNFISIFKVNEHFSAFILWTLDGLIEGEHKDVFDWNISEKFDVLTKGERKDVFDIIIISIK